MSHVQCRTRSQDVAGWLHRARHAHHAHHALEGERFRPAAHHGKPSTTAFVHNSFLNNSRRAPGNARLDRFCDSLGGVTLSKEKAALTLALGVRDKSTGIVSLAHSGPKH